VCADPAAPELVFLSRSDQSHGTVACRPLHEVSDVVRGAYAAARLLEILGGLA
jgi:hypothetical protein